MKKEPNSGPWVTYPSWTVVVAQRTQEKRILFFTRDAFLEALKTGLQALSRALYYGDSKGSGTILGAFFGQKA